MPGSWEFWNYRGGTLSLCFNMLHTAFSFVNILANVWRWRLPDLRPTSVASHGSASFAVEARSMPDFESKTKRFQAANLHHRNAENL